MARVAPEDQFAGLADPALLATRVSRSRSARSRPAGCALERARARAEAAALAVKGVSKSGGASASAGIGGMVLVTSHGFRGAYLGSRHSVVDVGDRRRRHRDGARLRFLLRAARRRSRCAGEDRPHRGRARGGAAQSAQGRDHARCRSCSTSASRARSSAISPARSTAAAIARKTSFLKDKLASGCSRRHPHHRRSAAQARPALAAVRRRGRCRQPLALIEDGVLDSWFLDSATARELGRCHHRPRAARRLVGAVAGRDQSPSRGRAR